MTRSELEKLACNLQDFLSEYRLRLTQTERQAITKTAMTLDLLIYNMPQHDEPELMGNEFVLSGVQTVEPQQKCTNCSECHLMRFGGGTGEWCQLTQKMIEQFRQPCEFWRERK